MLVVTGGVVTAASEQERLPDVLARADQLYKENKMPEALSYLRQFDTQEEAELLWRLARLCYKVGKYHSASYGEAEQLGEAGLRYAERAVAAEGDNFACHKWMGIVMSWASDFQGYKKKIERSFDIRDHFLKAIELNPTDATCRHILGQWCYSVASVPWYMKQAAKIIFATPPNSSYEEALSHFEAAEKVDPGFYCPNWLYLGKCYLQLGHREEARQWLGRIAGHHSELAEDREAVEEAKTLLKQLG